MNAEKLLVDIEKHLSDEVSFFENMIRECDRTKQYMVGRGAMARNRYLEFDHGIIHGRYSAAKEALSKLRSTLWKRPDSTQQTNGGASLND